MRWRIFKSLFALPLLATLYFPVRSQAQDVFVTYNPEQALHHFSSAGTDRGSFPSSGLHNPAYVERNASGDLFVANYGSNTVRHFSASGADLGDFALIPQSPPNTSNPLGLAFNGAGELFVTASGEQIYHFSSTGAYLGNFASTPNGANYIDLIFDRSGNLYVGDDIHNVVRRFSPTGVDLGIFASGLSHPGGLAFDQGGDLYVVNQSGGSIQRFSPTGANRGIFASGLNAPIDLDFDAGGNLYVSEFGGHDIREFSASGTNLGLFASTGPNHPYGLAIRDSAVPEPGAFAMMAGIAMFGTGLLAHRRLRR